MGLNILPDNLICHIPCCYSKPTNAAPSSDGSTSQILARTYDDCALLSVALNCSLTTTDAHDLETHDHLLFVNLTDDIVYG